MKAVHITAGAGIGALILAGAQVTLGIRPLGVVGWLAAPALAILLLGTTSVLARGEKVQELAPSDERPAAATSTKVATVALGVLLLVSIATAFSLARGEARGHALGHLVTGSACLSLFIVLGAWWRPPSSSASSTLRGLILALLWLSAAGVMLESVGASGYDAANEGARVDLLVSLHRAMVPAGALFLVGVPLGLVALAVVAASRTLRRLRVPPA